ncbi:hypothetical protein DID77_03775 [Candidatus Marinamargulisbacteria bacterium SCGC AG-439-L15]|nr:hypothetical protein DID77_03775 [Candidatus Marinamargulisbacteria bacterium SCGC AG-439-L15]
MTGIWFRIVSTPSLEVSSFRSAAPVDYCQRLANTPAAQKLKRAATVRYKGKNIAPSLIPQTPANLFKQCQGINPSPLGEQPLTRKLDFETSTILGCAFDVSLIEPETVSTIILLDQQLSECELVSDNGLWIIGPVESEDESMTRRFSYNQTAGKWIEIIEFKDLERAANIFWNNSEKCVVFDPNRLCAEHTYETIGTPGEVPEDAALIEAVVNMPTDIQYLAGMRTVVNAVLKKENSKWRPFLLRRLNVKLGQETIEYLSKDEDVFDALKTNLKDLSIDEAREIKRLGDTKTILTPDSIEELYGLAVDDTEKVAKCSLKTIRVKQKDADARLLDLFVQYLQAVNQRRKIAKESGIEEDAELAVKRDMMFPAIDSLNVLVDLLLESIGILKGYSIKDRSIRKNDLTELVLCMNYSLAHIQNVQSYFAKDNPEKLLSRVLSPRKKKDDPISRVEVLRLLESDQKFDGPLFKATSDVILSDCLSGAAHVIGVLNEDSQGVRSALRMIFYDMPAPEDTNESIEAFIMETIHFLKNDVKKRLDLMVLATKKELFKSIQELPLLEKIVGQSLSSKESEGVAAGRYLQLTISAIEPLIYNVNSEVTQALLLETLKKKITGEDDFVEKLYKEPAFVGYVNKANARLQESYHDSKLFFSLFSELLLAITEQFRSDGVMEVVKILSDANSKDYFHKLLKGKDSVVT